MAIDCHCNLLLPIPQATQGLRTFRPPVRRDAGLFSREGGDHRVRRGRITLTRGLPPPSSPAVSGLPPPPKRPPDSFCRASRGSWQHAKLLHSATLGRVAHLLPPHEPALLAPQRLLTRSDCPCNAGPQQMISGGAVSAGDASMLSRVLHGELAASLRERSGSLAGHCREKGEEMNVNML